jgi:hypothetical protein
MSYRPFASIRPPGNRRGDGEGENVGRERGRGKARLSSEKKVGHGRVFGFQLPVPPIVYIVTQEQPPMQGLGAFGGLFKVQTIDRIFFGTLSSP